MYGLIDVFSLSVLHLCALYVSVCLLVPSLYSLYSVLNGKICLTCGLFVIFNAKI